MRVDVVATLGLEASNMRKERAGDRHHVDVPAEPLVFPDVPAGRDPRLGRRRVPDTLSCDAENDE